MKEILQLISNHTNVNFLQYKKSTLRRRLNKRLDALGIEDLEAYHKFLKTDPQEINNAFKVMLLGISEFFRDAEVFRYIKDCLANIVAHKQLKDSIRIWSVGCSRGEEPYSLAILLAELLEDFDNYDIKIFASDISEEAINYGRNAVYPEKTLQNLSREQIDKYFTKIDDDHFQVNEFLRKMVVFCKHDVTNDPPFLNIDLISCRNLLIYFDNDLQNKIIPIFNYSLVERGYLIIGKSESIDEHANIFELINAKNKLYKNREKLNANHIHAFKFHNVSVLNSRDQQPEHNKHLPIMTQAMNTIARTYEYPFVVVDANYDIVETYGELRPYLNFGNGKPGNFLEMISQDLHHEAHTAIIKTQQKNTPHKTNKVDFHFFNLEYRVQVEVKPIVGANDQVHHYLVIFKESDPMVKSRHADAADV